MMSPAIAVQAIVLASVVLCAVAMGVDFGDVRHTESVYPGHGHVMLRHATLRIRSPSVMLGNADAGAASDDHSSVDVTPIASAASYCGSSSTKHDQAALEELGVDVVTRAYLVHVKSPITERVKQSISQRISPYTLGEYIPQDTFVVVGPHGARPECHAFLTSLQSAPGVVAVLEYSPHMTYSEKLKREMTHLSKQEVLSAKVSAASLNSDRKEQQRVSLMVSLHRGSIPHLKEDISSTWLSALGGKSVASRLSWYRESALVFVHDVPENHLSWVVGWLAHHPLVAAVEHKPEFKTNNLWAHAVLQNDLVNGSLLYDHGLNGTGQILSTSDTGIDYDHCFFADPSRPVPINKVDYQHRKIIYYGAPPGFEGDASNGHGTHTAGSLVGGVLSSDAAAVDALQPFNGMAYEAKLCAYDIQGGGEDLFVAEDLYHDYLVSSYTKGSRISSNSWGSQDGTYGGYSQQIDRFQHDYPEHLTFFAAGNYGSNSHTLTSPGVAKNVVSVGSCKNSVESFEDAGHLFGIAVYLSPTSNQQVAEMKVTPATFSKPPVWSELSRMRLPALIPGQNASLGCEPYTDADFSNKIVVLLRGVCFFTQKVFYAQQAGAAVVIVRNTDDSDLAMYGDDSFVPQITVPSGMVTKSDGIHLINGSSLELPVLVQAALANNNERILSAFSSRGPTFDGRIKPDIVAPGQYIMSARSDGTLNTNNCPIVASEGVVANQGTSMATPVAAGTAALVRQYFEDGFYPSGERNASDSMRPSGALVKAVLINSGEGMPVASDDVYATGYGRVLLANVLRFASGSPGSNESLFVADNRLISAQESQAFCFAVGSNKHLKATVVWNDKEAALTSAHQLVNDLDLVVEDANNSLVYLGNPQFMSSQYDRINNVEEVELSGVQEGAILAVVVRGSIVPMGPQSFALLVRGGEQVDISRCSSSRVCPRNCGRETGGTFEAYGTCLDTGYCACHMGRYGPDCSGSVSALAPSSDSSLHAWTSGESALPIEVQRWTYRSFEITEEMLQNTSLWKLSISVTRTSSRGDPDVYVSTADSGGVPTFRSYNWSSTVPGNQNSLIHIQCEDLRPGTYYIGVWGYCCDASSVFVSASLLSIDSCEPSRGAAPGLSVVAILGLVVLCVGGVAGLVLLGVWWRRRQTAAAGYRAVQDPSGPAVSYIVQPAPTMAQITSSHMDNPAIDDAHSAVQA